MKRHGLETCASGPTLDQRGGSWRPATVIATGHADVLDWLTAHQDHVRDLLARYGATRLRGLHVTTETFAAAVRLLAGAPLADYVHRSTPRREVGARVFTSTEYPSRLAIPMHSEQSYTRTWPTLIGFWGRVPAPSGGATPLAPTAHVLDALPHHIVAPFRAHGVRYDRWYRPGLDLPWHEVFQTDDRQEVERLCHQAGMTTEWHPDNVLRTTHTAQALTIHPTTQQEVWFNQANLFHLAALPDEMAAVLRDGPAEYIPRTTSFGNGASIPNATITTINAAFAAYSWIEPWKPNDVLLVDNVAVAHGRQPYCGERQVLVAMA